MSRNNPGTGKDNWARAASVFTILAAIFVGVQGILLYQSNKINRESLVSVQRAFMTYRGLQSNREFRANSDSPTSGGTHVWTYAENVENSGVTPAIDATNSFSCRILQDEPTEEEFQGKKSEVPITTIGPKATLLTGRVSINEVAIVGRDLGELDHPIPKDLSQTHLVCWGWLAYRDVFPETKLHVTELCETLVAFKLFPGKREAMQDFGGCRQHNCTDEHCSDYAQIVGVVNSNQQK